MNPFRFVARARGVLTPALAGGLLLAALAGGRGVLAPETASAQSEDGCTVTAERTVDRTTVAAGETLDVEVSYDYTCQDDPEAVDVMIMVETTSYLRSGGANRNAMPKVQEALRGFVEALDFEAGTRAGLMYYNSGINTRVRLGGGEKTKDHLLQSLRSMPLADFDNSAGFPSALEDATAMLSSSARQGVPQFILVIDAGAPVATLPVVPYEEACQGARQADITVAVVSLKEADGRGTYCGTIGWNVESEEASASDLPPALERLALHTHKATAVWLDSYYDIPSSGIAYVPDSATPGEPNIEDGVVQWNYFAPAPLDGRTVRYQLRVDAEGRAREIDLSREAAVRLVFSDDRAAQFVRFDAIEVCIHAPGDPSFCEDDPPTPVPSPTPQPSPTTVPTEPPTSTPAPPTATPRPAGGTIFLPLALAGHALDAR